MPRFTRPGLTLAAGWLLATLCTAQTTAPTPPSTAVWRDGTLEVSTVEGAPWSQAIPFESLARSPGMASRFRQSTVTAQETMHPEGPTRSAKAVFRSRIWLQWGQGKTPLSTEVWPYRLIEHSASNGGVGYLWVNADLSKQLKATPQRTQSLRSGSATWCTWFTVVGERVSNPHIADGPTPTVHWMLWRKPTGTACR